MPSDDDSNPVTYEARRKRLSPGTLRYGRQARSGIPSLPSPGLPSRPLDESAARSAPSRCASPLQLHLPTCPPASRTRTQGKVRSHLHIAHPVDSTPTSKLLPTYRHPFCSFCSFCSVQLPRATAAEHGLATGNFLSFSAPHLHHRLPSQIVPIYGDIHCLPFSSFSRYGQVRSRYGKHILEIEPMPASAHSRQCPHPFMSSLASYYTEYCNSIRLSAAYPTNRGLPPHAHHLFIPPSHHELIQASDSSLLLTLTLSPVSSRIASFSRLLPPSHPLLKEYIDLCCLSLTSLGTASFSSSLRFTMLVSAVLGLT